MAGSLGFGSQLVLWVKAAGAVFLHGAGRFLLLHYYLKSRRASTETATASLANKSFAVARLVTLVCT